MHHGGGSSQVGIVHAVASEIAQCPARLKAVDPASTVRATRERGDGMDLTAAVAAEVALPPARGQGRSGAFTPGALFGPGLAEAVGGERLIDHDRTSSGRD